MIVQMSSCLSFHRYEVLGNRASVFVTDRLIAISSNLPIKYHKIVSLRASLLQAVSGIHLCTSRLSTQSINRGAQEMVSNPDSTYKYCTCRCLGLAVENAVATNTSKCRAADGHSHELHECQFLHHEFYGIWLFSPKPSMNSKNGHCWFHEFQE